MGTGYACLDSVLNFSKELRESFSDYTVILSSRTNLVASGGVKKYLRASTFQCTKKIDFCAATPDARRY